jgi:hypothetical protein
MAVIVKKIVLWRKEVEKQAWSACSTGLPQLRRAAHRTLRLSDHRLLSHFEWFLPFLRNHYSRAVGFFLPRANHRPSGTTALAPVFVLPFGA